VVETLVDQSLERGAIDNVTVVAVRFGRNPLASDPPGAP
jgi:serine/threonine protein phosphatase PrpC